MPFVSIAAALEGILERQEQAREDETPLHYGGENLRLERQTVNNLHRILERAEALLDYFQSASLPSSGGAGLYLREFESLLGALQTVEDGAVVLAQFAIPQDQEALLRGECDTLAVLLETAQLPAPPPERFRNLLRTLSQARNILLRLEQILVDPIYGI